MFVTSVLVWFWFCCVVAVPVPGPSPSCPLMSSESMLEAEAELTLERDDLASWSLTVPTEPVRRWCCELAAVFRRVADEYDEDEEGDEDSEVCRAASSILRDAFSNWAVMSSSEKLEATVRDWPWGYAT